MPVQRLKTSYVLLAVFFAVVTQTSTRCADNIEIEVATFQGGFGIDFFERSAREYEKLHPHVKIKLWGHPRVWEKLMPRFGSGKPPDLTWPGAEMNLYEMIKGGQLFAWDDYLKQPASGSDKQWLDTFKPSLMALQKYRGRYYMLPYQVTAFGWYFNRKLFRENGWTPPQTYSELLALCEKIKAKKIAPVTFTGRYPQYPILGMFFPWMVSAGGYAPYKAAENLEPGAWKHPAILRAAETIMEMKQRGNFENGCIGMNHTESQMEFLMGRAAMILCGTWFHSEMANVMDKDFEAEFMLTPRFDDQQDTGTYLMASVDGQWILPAKGRHRDVAADFYRFMSSPDKSREFMEQKGTLMAVYPTQPVNAPETMKEPLRHYLAAKATMWSHTDAWYPAMGKAMVNSFRDLYNEQITPAEFIGSIELEADKIRRDPEVDRFTLE
ncbi:MAG: extracellular solute-binding protein [Candidatus Sumerlaeaceae bacterium]